MYRVEELLARECAAFDCDSLAFPAADEGDDAHQPGGVDVAVLLNQVGRWYFEADHD